MSQVRRHGQAAAEPTGRPARPKGAVRRLGGRSGGRRQESGTFHPSGEAESQWLAAIVNSSDDAIVGETLYGVIISWNRGAERIYGYSAEEAVGRPISFLVPPDQPDEIPEILRRVRQGEAVEHHETVRLCKDGRRISVSVTVSPVKDAVGRVMGASAISRNITELDKLELRFQAFLEAAPDAMLIADRHGRIVRLNAQTETLFGYRRGELLGQPVERLIAMPFRDKHSVHMAGFFAAPSARPMGAGLELYALRKDGSEFPAEISLSPMVSKDRLLVTAAIRDITERKAVEEQVKASLREKEALLREVHHRVRNNLQIISSLLRLQSEGVRGPDDALRALRESEERIQSMALLHESLYRSADVGRVNFQNYLDSLMAEIDSTCGVRHVALKTEADIPELDIDKAVPLGLLINELVTNCLKHAFPDRRAGEVRVRLAGGGLGVYVLTVCDNGVGLPEDLNERKASSLGLQMVETLSRQLKGAYEFRRDGGTQFYLTFSP